MELQNPCLVMKDHCLNCHSHFNTIRPTLTKALISKQVKKDIKNYHEIIKEILNCSNINYNELHKFEEKYGDIKVFRAKKDKFHYVYAIDKEKRLILLRAFTNFQEYRKFLLKKNDIIRMVKQA